MVHLCSFRKVKAFGRTNSISSSGCPSEHPEQRGNGNNDSGLPNTFIAGSGIIAAALPGGNGGLFANEIVIQNIPAVNAITYPLLQPGQLYTVIAAPGFTNRPIFIV